MTIGAAIFVAAVGAILRFAINGRVSGVDIPTVGTILIITGVIGLIVGLALEFSGRDRVADPREPREPREPRDRRY